eukprot:403337956
MLTATISHELMNPLNSIIGLSGIAEQQNTELMIYEKLVSDWSYYFKIINQSAKLMNFLVKSQIDIQQIREGRFTPKISSRKPSEVVKEIIDLFTMQLEQKKVKISIIQSQDISQQLSADWDRYQQILINFVQNSAKFTVKGEINLILMHQSNQAVEKDSKDDKNKATCRQCGYLVTKIIDSGIGMEQKTLSNLFQIFNNAQINESGMIATSGIGLGLSMSKDLLQALNGKVSIESVKNQGTEVTFKIKVNQEQCIRCNNQQSSKNSQSLASALSIINSSIPYEESRLKLISQNQEIQRQLSGLSAVKQSVRMFFQPSPKILELQQMEQSSVTSGVGTSGQTKFSVLSSSRLGYTMNHIQPIQLNSQLNSTLPIQNQSSALNNSQWQRNKLNLSNQQYSSLIRDRTDNLPRGLTNNNNNKYQNIGNQNFSSNGYYRPYGGMEEQGSRSIQMRRVFGDYVDIQQINNQVMQNDKIKQQALLTQMGNSTRSLFDQKLNVKSLFVKDSKKYSSFEKTNGLTSIFNQEVPSKNIHSQSSSKQSQDKDSKAGQEKSKRRSRFQKLINISHDVNLPQINMKIENDPYLVTSQNINALQMDSKFSSNKQQNSQMDGTIMSSSIQNSTKLRGVQQNIYQFKNKMQPKYIVDDILNDSSKMKFLKEDITIHEQDEESLQFPDECYSEHSYKQKNNLQEMHDTRVQFANKYSSDIPKDNSLIKLKNLIIKPSKLRNKQYESSQVASTEQVMLDVSDIKSTSNYINQLHDKKKHPGLSKLIVPQMIEYSSCSSRQSQNLSNRSNFEEGEDSRRKLKDGQKQFPVSSIQSQEYSQKLNNHSPSRQDSQEVRRFTLGAGPDQYIIEDLDSDSGGTEKHQIMLDRMKSDISSSAVRSPNLGGFFNSNFYSNQRQSLEESRAQRLSIQQDQRQRSSHNSGAEQEMFSIINIQNPIFGNLPASNNVFGQSSVKQMSSGKFCTEQLQLQSIAQIQLQNENENHVRFDSSDSLSCQSSKPPKTCSCESLILIVDDMMFNIIPLEIIIRDQIGFKVDKAYNGQEAVDLYKINLEKTCCNVKYKLILMDLNMPIMDGFEATLKILEMNSTARKNLISQIQQNKKVSINSSNKKKELYQDFVYDQQFENENSIVDITIPQVKVVAVTAFVNEENVNYCYQVGMSEVLNKPVESKNLKQVINQYLNNLS